MIETVVVGAGGHARVVYEILRTDQNVRVSAFLDNTPRGSDEQIMGIPVIGGHDVLPEYSQENDITGYIVAIGDNEVRANHFEKFREMGLNPIQAIHPNAHVAESASVGPGSVVASGAIVTTNAEIGKNAVVNTGAIIEHECELGNHTHVAPGTTVAGRVTIKKSTFIGMGSSIKEYTSIGPDTIVGAGSVVLDNVEAGQTVAGSPAEPK